MLAVTTAAAALADGALAAAGSGARDAAADRGVMARFFAANRLAAVPGLHAAVTEPADDLAAAAPRLLAHRPTR